MAETLKKVRFKLAWQNYRVGDEITPNGTLRDFLVGNGFAVIVDEPSPVRAQGVNRQAQPTSRRASR